MKDRYEFNIGKDKKKPRFTLLVMNLREEWHYFCIDFRIRRNGLIKCPNITFDFVLYKFYFHIGLKRWYVV